MKLAIATERAALEALQLSDDDAAGLPWPGVYLDGSPAPDGQGVTLHVRDVQPHPKDAKWAYPVADDAQAKAKPGEPLAKATIVDKLDATWAVAVEAPKGEPIEEPKPIDDFAVPVK